MSVYAYIAGEIEYPDLERYEAAKKIIRDGGWIDEDDAWLDETGALIENDCFHEKSLSITIPSFPHRNLLHVLGKLTNGASSVGGQWASTDGMFSGGPLVGDEVDLHEWAKGHGLGGEEGYDAFPENDDDWDDYAEWQIRVIDAFMED